MKTKFLIIAIFAPLLFSCEKQIPSYDNERAFIYFNMPFPVDALGRVSNSRVDSLYYSFGLDDISVTEATIGVPVNILGVTADYDREYKVEIDTLTTALDGDWDTGSIASTVIEKGKWADTIHVRVFRTEETKTMWKQIVLRLVPNDNFEAGFKKLLTAKVTFSSILAPPDWWSDWRAYFGKFSREKYLKWKEIYYEGVDPNLSTMGEGKGKPLYWDNMPPYASQRDFPSTFLFLVKLKKYFDENEVYPDGDTTQDRIFVP